MDADGQRLEVPAPAFEALVKVAGAGQGGRRWSRWPALVKVATAMMLVALMFVVIPRISRNGLAPSR